MLNIDEVWKPIPGWPYEASSHGRIRRSVDAPNGRSFAGKILKQKKGKGGYLRVGLSKKGVPMKWFGSHTLIATAFHGEQPQDKPHCAHNDGCPGNNTPDNLRWATCKENFADKVAHKTHNRGSRHYRTRLYWEDVIDLRFLHSAAVNYKGSLFGGGTRLRHHFNMTPIVAEKILAYRSWTDSAEVLTPFSFKPALYHP